MLETFIYFLGDIITQVVSKAPKIENKDDEIRFEFNKVLRIVMLLCAIPPVIGLSISIVWAIIDNEIIVIFLILAFGFWLTACIYGYLVQKNKKIVLKQNIFYVTNFLGRIKEYRFDDIIKAKYLYGDGVVLYTWSNQKFKVDEQMSNYRLLVGKLLEKEIKIINWRGDAVK